MIFPAIHLLQIADLPVPPLMTDRSRPPTEVFSMVLRSSLGSWFLMAMSRWSESAIITDLYCSIPLYHVCIYIYIHTWWVISNVCVCVYIYIITIYMYIYIIINYIYTLIWLHNTCTGFSCRIYPRHPRQSQVPAKNVHLLLVGWLLSRKIHSVQGWWPF